MTIIVRIKEISPNDPMSKYKNQLVGSLFKIDQYSGCFHERILRQRIHQGHRLTLVLFPIKLFSPKIETAWKFPVRYLFTNIVLELVE